MNINNFLMGKILARGLSNQAQLQYGLAASFFPKQNVIAPFVLKPQIDASLKLQSENTGLQVDVKKLTDIKEQLQRDKEGLQGWLDRLPIEVQIPVAWAKTDGAKLTLGWADKAGPVWVTESNAAESFSLKGNDLVFDKTKVTDGNHLTISAKVFQVEQKMLKVRVVP